MTKDLNAFSNEDLSSYIKDLMAKRAAIAAEQRAAQKVQSTRLRKAKLSKKLGGLSEEDKKLLQEIQSEGIETGESLGNLGE